MKRIHFLRFETTRREVLTTSHVAPIPGICIQCGICTYNCPVDIDVRRHAWLGSPVKDSRCFSCGECIARCPRKALRFETTHLFQSMDEKGVR